MHLKKLYPLKVMSSPQLPDIEEVKKIFCKHAGNYDDYQLPENEEQRRREKAKVTIEVFFQLLNKIAEGDKTHDRHWRARREFWRTYIAAGKVEDAWMVLGKKYLHDIDSLPSAAKELGYATFINHNKISPSHCAIIMKIRNFIIAEWSHNGALRIWRAKNSSAPKLHRKHYYPHKLKKNEDKCFVHHKNWQQHVREFIDDEDKFRIWRK